MSRLTRIITAAAMFFCLGIAPVQAAQSHTGWVSPCGAPYIATGTRSLDFIAVWIAGDPVSQLLRDSMLCGPGRNWDYRVQIYLNKGNLRACMPKGSRLWFSRLP